MALLPQMFGDYELRERLGVGGMAETFVAVRRGPSGFQQRVCLKRVLETFRDDPEFIEMFLQESRLSALLHHNHIARVLDFGVVDGAHYLTLELIEGTDLRQLLCSLREYGERLDPEVVTHLARALASALDFAHTADDTGRATGIVHRDVSPSNVLLSYAGEVKLADFGIAKRTHRPNSLQSTVLKGKIPYMAPEYAVVRHYDARTDLFSLGVLLYECLAGKRPFDGGNDIETLERARRGEREPLAWLAGDAPPPLVDAIESLLTNDRAHRPPNAGTFLDRLAPVRIDPLTRRTLADEVRRCKQRTQMPSAPGLASTRPVATQRPRKRRPSQN